MRSFSLCLLACLALLFSCTNSWFINQPGKPYYFSKKKNTASQPIAARATGLAAFPVGPVPDSSPAHAYSASAGPAPVHATAARAKQPTREQGKKAPDGIQTGYEQFEQPQRESRASAVPDRKQQRQTSDFAFLGAAALGLVLMTSLFALLMHRSKGIAYWAKENRKKSWALIGLGQLMLGFGGTAAGRVLDQLGYQTTEITTNLLVATAVLAFVAYPSKHTRKSNVSNYLSSKIATLLLLFSGTLLFLNIGNRYSADKSFSPLTGSIECALQFDRYITQLITETITPITAPDSAASPADAGTIILLILAVLAYVSLLMLLAALSCMIACGGLIPLAALVFLGGLYLLTMPFIWLVKEIFKAGKYRSHIRNLSRSEDKRKD